MATFEIKGNRIPVKVLDVDSLNNLANVAFDSGKRLWVNLGNIKR